MKRVSALPLAAAFAFSAILAAQTPTTEARVPPDQAKHGAAEDDDMIGWRWANFVVLAAVLGFFAFKYGNPYFSKETVQIRAGLDEARVRREDAERRAADVQKRLANLGAEVEALRKTAAEERAREIQTLQARLQSETAFLRASTEAQIENFGRNTTLELRRHAARLALELAEQRIRGRMNPDLERSLAAQFVEGLKA